MPRARRVCSIPGCPELTTGGACSNHARPTAAQRGYTNAGHRRFRAAVLTRNPVCVLCHEARATVADHYPTSRRDLIAQGSDPDDPTHGRGLCKPCHDRHTARTQPGGWHDRG